MRLDMLNTTVKKIYIFFYILKYKNFLKYFVISKENDFVLADIRKFNFSGHHPPSVNSGTYNNIIK